MAPWFVIEYGSIRSWHALMWSRSNLMSSLNQPWPRGLSGDYPNLEDLSLAWWFEVLDLRKFGDAGAWACLEHWILDGVEKTELGYVRGVGPRRHWRCSSLDIFEMLSLKVSLILRSWHVCWLTRWYIGLVQRWDIFYLVIGHVLISFEGPVCYCY